MSPPHISDAQACSGRPGLKDARSRFFPHHPMPGLKRLFGRTCLLIVALLVLGPRLHAARNAVTWNFVNLPANGSVGQAIQFAASVTNAGDARWGGSHFLEVRDQDGAHLGYLPLEGTAPREIRLVTFSVTLPAKPGSYAFHFSALENGLEYFGPEVSRTITVRPPPLAVSLVIDDDSILLGQRATIRSEAGIAGEVAVHGLEGRTLGGTWQTWTSWSDRGGEIQVGFAQPEAAGIYELRALAGRTKDDEPSYSNRLLLVVMAIAPGIAAQPGGAVANVGERVALTVVPTGSPPQYQWRKDGVDVAGATAATLVLSPAQVAQSGGYTVVVSNSAGAVTSRVAAVVIAPLSLPAVSLELSSFAGGRAKHAVEPSAAQVGDVASVGSVAALTAGTGWRHNVLIRRAAVTAPTALAPEDGSGFSGAQEAWNKDGWGNPHTDGNSYDSRVTGQAAVDLGNREPFIHVLATGQTGSTRAIDFVLDAPGTWLIRTEVVDGAGQLIAVSATTTLVVAAAGMAGDPANLTYPYGRADRFVGVYWNAGQAHRLWSTWRAEFQTAYAATWAVNWKLMWQPSPYFRGHDGNWLKPNPAAESPWQAFWSGHQVYALVPDGAGASTLSHDLTSRAFAEKAALRLMDVGVDFVMVDYTNQFLEEREDVFPALENLAHAFQAVAQQSQSGQRIKLSAVLPANIASGDWDRSGGFGPVAIARFNAKLTTLYNRFARYERGWFYLEDDRGVRKPLLLLWVGASGEGEPDGTLAPARLAQLRLEDGRAMTEVFTIRWVGAYLADNRRFLANGAYTVSGIDGPVTGKYANAKLWSYRDNFPGTATLAPGAVGASPAIEAITVQPLAAGHDRFGRAWDENWPATEAYHYETPAPSSSVPLAGYGRTWREALVAARALNPKFILTTWAEFGSENDEPRPELSVTIMDNNKFGPHFGDALRQAVRQFKYQAPTAWIDALIVGDAMVVLGAIPSSALPAVRLEQIVRLQGWVTPNVATTFAGGSVKVFVDEVLRGTATVGGAWNGATQWRYDLPAALVGYGTHLVRAVVEDGNGGSANAGVQFQGDVPRHNFILTVVPGRG